VRSVVARKIAVQPSSLSAPGALLVVIDVQAVVDPGGLSAVSAMLGQLRAQADGDDRGGAVRRRAPVAVGVVATSRA
jgi:hypothetical protein